MIKYLHYNYAQCKTSEPIKKLINVLDFYEFEQKDSRVSFIEAVQTFKKYRQGTAEIFKKAFNCLGIKDSILWDYLWSMLGFKAEILDKKFPSDMASLPYIKINFHKHPHKKAVLSYEPYISLWDESILCEYPRNLIIGGNTSSWCQEIEITLNIIKNVYGISEEHFHYAAKNPDSSTALKLTQFVKKNRQHVRVSENWISTFVTL